MARHWQFVSSSPFLLSCSTPSNHTHKTRSDLATLKLLSSLQTPSPSPSALHIRKRLHFLMVRSFYFSEAMKLKSVQTICALQSETPCAQLSNIIKQRQTTIIIINEKKINPFWKRCTLQTFSNVQVSTKRRGKGLVMTPDRFTSLIIRPTRHNPFEAISHSSAV